MSIGRHIWTREEARKAISARWTATHAGLPPRPPAAPLDGRLLRRVIVEDLLVGKRHELNFYGTKRLNCYDVLVERTGKRAAGRRRWRGCGRRA